MDIGRRLLNVDDVADMVGCCKSSAYKIIQELNKELKAEGYIVIRGKISASKLRERIHGL